MLCCIVTPRGILYYPRIDMISMLEDGAEPETDLAMRGMSISTAVFPSHEGPAQHIPIPPDLPPSLSFQH